MENNTQPQKSQEFLETKKIMLDYVLMLIAPVIFALFNYGTRALVLIATSVLTALICRRLGSSIFKSQESTRDFSSLVIGTTVALLLPINAPWWLAVSGAFFAVVVCVLPFGSIRKSPFVPAAAAISFLVICWSELMFNYTAPDEFSLSEMLLQSNSIGRNAVAYMEVMTGAIPTAIGAGSLIALLGSLLFLIIRRPKDSVGTLAFIFAVIIMAVIFPRVSTGRVVSVIMELSSGMLLFSAIFFMSYPSVMPEKLLPRALWGFTGGIICMLVRLFGVFEESVCFSILIICSMTELFDMINIKEKKISFKKKEKAPTVVPEEILNKIPDLTEQEILEQTREIKIGEEAIVEATSLTEVVAEENTIETQDAPFSLGGGIDE